MTVGKVVGETQGEFDAAVWVEYAAGVRRKKKKVNGEPSGDAAEGKSLLANKGSFGSEGRDPREAAERSLEARGLREPAVPREVPALVVVEGEGLLGSMRHVLANVKAHDATEEQKQARGWLADDRTGWFREKAKLEAAELIAKGKGKGGSDELVVEDVGTTAALGLVDELLRKAGEGR